MDRTDAEAITIKTPDVKIYWTGGMDSSYRMVQLSKHDITIQPYYLCDNRHSEQNELQAIASIISDIDKHPETLCTILPLIKVKVSDVEPDIEISEAYKRFYKYRSIGSQFDWMARFAKTCQGIEVCLEKFETNSAYMSIAEKGGLIRIKEGDILYIKLDKAKSDKDLYKVFGNFHFPLPLFEITKLEELHEYKKLGFGETINKTWFCHHPIKNEPCGICNPCKAVVEKGLSFRLTPAGIERNKTEKKYGDKTWFIYAKKIRRRIVGY